MVDHPLSSETKEEYDQDAQRYFRNTGSGSSRADRSKSADQPGVAANFLPSEEETYRKAKHLELGFYKTERSGARVNSPSSVPAIFPQGLSKASAIIDELTPKGYKQSEPMKPPSKQERPTGWFPKASAVIDRCIDCMEPLNPQNYVLGMAGCTDEHNIQYSAAGLKFGDLVLYGICGFCDEKIKREARNSTPLVLIKGGNLTSEEDICIALKYGFPLVLHDGQEATLGQWRMCLWQEAIMLNMWNYLREQNQVQDSSVFRNRGKETE